MSLKIICTTSNAYLHIIPVFEYLYKKYWNDANIEIIGYEKPVTSLPFVSLGIQGGVKEWSTDLRRYFESIPDKWIIWIMEDTLLRSQVNMPLFRDLPLQEGIGKICLTSDVSKREHTNDGYLVHASPTSRYRLSMQPSIWNRNYLLQYLADGMDPWTAETQDPKNDGWDVVGFVNPPVVHNEGVTRHDIFKLNLTGMCDEDAQAIKMLAPWMK